LSAYATKKGRSLVRAIQERLNGKAVDWMEKVTDEQYQAVSKPE
jgi:hypothetical protein